MPVVESMSHSVSHGDSAVWPLPSQLTGLEVPEKTSKSFGFTLSDPGSVLKLPLSSGLLECLSKLMLDSMLHELKCAWILVVVPVLCHVQELSPGWFADPVLWCGFGGFEETLYGSWGWVRLVLDEAQACLELFPKGWFACLPDWTGLGRGEWFVLRLEVGGSPFDRNPVRKVFCWLIGHGVVELDFFDLCDVGGPWPKTGIGPVRECREGAQLVVVPEVVWQRQCGRQGTAHSVVIEVRGASWLWIKA